MLIAYIVVYILNKHMHHKCLHLEMISSPSL